MQLPKIKANVIMADPAWNQKKWSAKGDEGRPQHYDRMTLKQICDMPISECAEKDCHLFLWTTSPHLEQAFTVIRAWGFRYSSVAFTWIKLNPKAPTLFFTQKDLHLGQGYTTRKNAEFCLLGRRGSPKRLDKGVHEVIISPRREHSRKPDEAYDRIERYTHGPYLELFSRQNRKNWETWGNETGKFDGKI